MSRLLLACILIAGCADAGGTQDAPQRQAGEAALADPFGYGPNIEKLAAEKTAEHEAQKKAPTADKDTEGDSLGDQWRRFWNP